jgi:hypothetical protein
MGDKGGQLYSSQYVQRDSIKVNKDRMNLELGTQYVYDIPTYTCVVCLQKPSGGR